MSLMRKPTWEPTRPASISSRIVTQVIDKLFRKELRPGDFLGTEAQLAKAFHASRMPVREALSRLEALGVVEIRTGAAGGAIIAKGEPVQFAVGLAVQFALIGVTAKEIFDARIAIETTAAELAAANATEAELANLEALLKEAEKKNGGGPETVDCILKFHLAIVEASRTRTLTALMQALLQSLANTYLDTSPPPPGRSPAGFTALRNILRKIQSRDSEGARRAMREHLIWQRDSVLARLEKKTRSAAAKRPAS